MFVGAFGALLMIAAPIPSLRGGECFFALGAGFFFFQITGSSTRIRKTADSGRAAGLRCILQISTREADEVLPLLSAVGSTFHLRMFAASHPVGTPVLGLRKHGNSEEVAVRA
jgi:hypothetical protein